MSASLTVWGIGTSRTLRAHWALEEVGVEYGVRDILPRSGETNTAAYRLLNPAEKIPLLQHGELTLSESAAIVTYVLDVFGDGRLVPRGARERALYDQWSFFVMMELDATALYVLRRHLGLPSIYGEAPAAVASAREYFRRQARVAEQQLQDDRPFLLGDSFTGADILLSTCLGWATLVDETLPQGLERYQARVTDREPYRNALRTNFPPKALAAIQPRGNA